MNPVEVPLPPDHRRIQTISRHQHSCVMRARDPQGRDCCLKLVHFQTPSELQAQICFRNDLMRLTQGTPGLLPLWDWGANTDTGTLWEKYPLADDATGPRPDASGDYHPLTLAEWSRRNAQAPTRTVIDWGIRLARATDALHKAGLLHLDIKPPNILFLEGMPVLGDYGSINRSASPHRFLGSDGYYPPDKDGSPSLDVFALGRTLYEVWTGLERYRFPSLPERLVSDPEWPSHGWMLNEALIRATDIRATRRFPDAETFARTLSEAARGRTRISRRKAAATLVTLGASAMGIHVARNLPSHHAVWRHRSKARFGYEMWNATELTTDWKTRMLYCVTADFRGTYLQRYDLERRKWSYSSHPKGPQRVQFCSFAPWGDDLVFSEAVSGQVFRMPLDGSPPEAIPTRTVNQLDFTGSGYLNPINQRIGVFAGYGNLRAHNRRQEYDPQTGRWENMAETSPLLPWPRIGSMVFPGKDRKSWFFLGGSGNREGAEGRPEPRLKYFTGTFYPLWDFWRLDLATQRWSRLLDVQEWTPAGLRKAIYHPTLDAVLILTGHDPTQKSETRLHLWSESAGHLPKALPNRGETPPSLFRCWTLLMEPDTQDLLVFADDGIWSVSLKPA